MTITNDNKVAVPLSEEDVVLLRHLLANREQIAMVTLHKYNMSNSTSADEGGFLANELKHVRWLRARMVSALELLSHSRRG